MSESSNSQVVLSRRFTFKRVIAILFLPFLLGTGFAGSLGYQWLKPTPSAAAVKKSVPHEDPLHEEQSSHPRGEYAEIDAAIGVGEWAESLDLLERKQHEAEKPEATFATTYRVALCREGLGEFAKARSLHMQALSQSKANYPRSLAHCGLIRCDLALGNLDAANERIRIILRTSGDPTCRENRIFEECFVLGARIALARLGDSRTCDPLDPYAVASPSWESSPSQILERLSLAEKSLHNESHESPLHIDRAPDGNLLVTMRSSGKSPGRYLEEITRAAERNLTLDPALKKTLEEQVIEVDLHRMPLAEAVRSLLAVPGLTVADTGLRIEIVPEDLTDPSQYAAKADAAVQSVIAINPMHPSALIARGNRAFAQRQWRAAMIDYQNVRASLQGSESTTIAAYNLGLTHLVRCEPLNARNAFLTMVDFSYSSQWMETGRWWVARADLDLLAIKSAKAGFRNSLKSKIKSIRSASALGLAACHLFEDDHDKSRDVLTKNRLGPDDRHESLGSVWNSWCRFRTTPTETRKSQLADALKKDSIESALGPVGLVLLGQAMKDAGETKTMISLFTRWSPQVNGVLGERMAMMTAEEFHRSENLPAARSRYLALVSSSHLEIQLPARLRLAEIELAGGNAKACLQLFGPVTDFPKSERSHVLYLKGRAFESLGRYDLAAACFTGNDP